MKKIILILSLMILLLSSYVSSAPTGIYYLNHTFNDFSGLGRNLTNNGATLTDNAPVYNISGNGGNASFCDGADDMQMPHFTANSHFSISIWANASANAHLGYFNLGSKIQMSYEGLKLVFYADCPNWVDAISDNNVVDNQWHHYVIRYNDTSKVIDMFVDGALQSNTGLCAGAFDQGAVANYFCADSGGGNQLTGNVDQIFIWNDTVLEQQNITNLYQYGNITGVQSPTITNFSLTLKDNYTNTAINNFSAIVNGTLYSTVNTTLYTNIVNSTNVLVNITFINDEAIYFNKTFINVNTTGTFDGDVFQSIVNVSVNRTFIRDEVCNFSLFDDNLGIIVLNTSSCSGLMYPPAGDYNYTILDNTGIENFTEDNSSLTVNALDNISVLFTVFGHFININASNIFTGVGINVFSVNITALNFTDIRNLSTSNGIIRAPAVDGFYNVTITGAQNFAVSGLDNTFNQTVLVQVNNSQLNFSVTFELYPYNSINFTFYNEETPLDLLTGVNISLSLINSIVLNYSTSNGIIFVENVTTDSYEARYSASGFDPRSFFFTVTNSSTQSIRLYLSNTSNTEQWVIRVADSEDDDVIGVIVRLQQQFVDMNGQFVTVEECETNSDGRCDMFIREEADIFYRFIVLVDDEIVLTTVPSPIFVLVGQVRLMTLRISGSTQLLEPDILQSGLFSSMTYNNNTNIVNYTWIDSNNAISNACLTISRRIIPRMNFTTLSEECFVGFSGTLTSNISTFIINNSEITMVGSVDFVNNRQVLQSISLINFAQGVGDRLSFLGSDELLLTAFAFLIISGSTILIPSLLVQAGINFSVLVLLGLLGFNQLGLRFTIGFMILAMFIAWSSRQNRGVDQ